MEYWAGVKKKCPVCKHTFWATPEWVYRRKDCCFCSWKGLRAYEKVHGDIVTRKHGGHHKPITLEQREEVKRRLQAGERGLDIAVDMDISTSAIDKMRKEMKTA